MYPSQVSICNDLITLASSCIRNDWGALILVDERFSKSERYIRGVCRICVVYDILTLRLIKVGQTRD